MTAPWRTADLGRRALLGCALVAVPSLALLLLGAVLEPERAAFAYLVAFVVTLSLVLGSLLWVMIQHTTGACWFVALRRTSEQATRPLLLLAVLFLPILASLSRLYPWARAPADLEPRLREAVHAKDAYLDPTFFAVRAGLYFAIWIGVGALLRRWSLRQDSHPDDGLVRRQLWLAAAALPLAGLALHFAAVDWLMSLDPAWASSMFGVYVFAGSALGSLALLILTASVLDARGVLNETLRISHYHALGKLLFTMLVFWAYVAYYQFFLIWSANIPEEASWYVRRIEGAWRPVALLLVFGHFVVPFFALLSRELRRSRRRLAWVAGWLLLMHVADVYWIVMPASDAVHAWPHWIDLAALAGVGALVAGVAIAWAQSEPPLALGDPRLARALRFHTQ